MDGPAFKEALAKLGYTQSSFAREFRFQLRTVQNWAKSGPPEFMEPLLGSMLRQTVPPPDSQKWETDSVAVAEGARALDTSLHMLIQRAIRAGWPRDVIIAGAMNWLAELIASKR